MPVRFSPQELSCIPATLSKPRFDTYLTACDQDIAAALHLYHWNAEISAALLFPLHIFEICFRNPAANVIESCYNPSWPNSNAFGLSLPDAPKPYFSPRREIRRAARRNPTTGKVIADLKFAFWVSMYTSRHQGRLWAPYIAREYPNLPAEMTLDTARRKIHDTADGLRELRNRIAHHEPIFRRDLVSDYKSILEIVTYRCAVTAGWMSRSQQVTDLLTLKP